MQHRSPVDPTFTCWILLVKSAVLFRGAFTTCSACSRAAAAANVLAVKRGDRIAQLILERISTPEVVEVPELDDTDRGAGGFGSTGVSAPSAQ